VVSFPQVSSPEPCAPLSSPPYAPHARPISFFSILPPAQYSVRSTDQLCGASKEIPCVLQLPKIHYRIHENPSICPYAERDKFSRPLPEEFLEDSF